MRHYIVLALLVLVSCGSLTSTAMQRGAMAEKHIVQDDIMQDELDTLYHEQNETEPEVPVEPEPVKAPVKEPELYEEETDDLYDALGRLPG